MNIHGKIEIRKFIFKHYFFFKNLGLSEKLYYRFHHQEAAVFFFFYFLFPSV
jgi:hypothetical protein